MGTRVGEELRTRRTFPPLRSVVFFEYSARRLVRETRHLRSGIRTVLGSGMKREKKA